MIPDRLHLDHQEIYREARRRQEQDGASEPEKTFSDYVAEVVAEVTKLRTDHKP